MSTAVSIARQLVCLLDEFNNIACDDHVVCEVQESARSDDEFIVVAQDISVPDAPKRCYRVTVALDDEETP